MMPRSLRAVPCHHPEDASLALAAEADQPKFSSKNLPSWTADKYRIAAMTLNA